MSPWLFNVYMDVVMKEVKLGIERMGVRFTLLLVWRLLGFVWRVRRPEDDGGAFC